MIDLFGLTDDQTVVYEGKVYTFSPLNIDISTEFEEAPETVIMTHKISGFDGGALYMVMHGSEGSFFFGHHVANGLFATLQDELLYKKAVDLVVSVVGGE